jgi:group I intron endonuclease
MTKKNSPGCVYKITNSINGKCYIGLTTKGIEKRWGKHVADSERSNRPHAIHRAIRKYGREAFIVEMLFQSDNLNALNIAEKQLIESFGSLYPNGYNLHGGGNAHTISEITRKNMSVAQIGKKQSQETRDKRSAKLSGRHPTKEQVEQMAKSRSKPVVEVNSGKKFGSVNEAASHFNVKSRGISKNLHGQSNHYFGLKFKFLESICS